MTAIAAAVAATTATIAAVVLDRWLFINGVSAMSPITFGGCAGPVTKSRRSVVREKKFVASELRVAAGARLTRPLPAGPQARRGPGALLSGRCPAGITKNDAKNRSATGKMPIEIQRFGPYSYAMVPVPHTPLNAPLFVPTCVEGPNSNALISKSTLSAVLNHGLKPA